MSRSIVLIIIILAAAGCPPSTTRPQKCEPGHVTACACGGLDTGTKTCPADGSDYGECVCAGEGECEPGEVMDCSCDAGTAGSTTCNDEGSAWGDCACACDNCAPPTALAVAPPSGAVIEAGFPFLEAADEVSLAMKTLWEEGLKASETSEEKSASMAAQDAALVVIQSNLVEAQALLLTALQSIEGDDLSRYQSLTPLLKVAGDSSSILAHFQGIAMREPSAAEQEVTHDATDAEFLRGFAMRMLAHQAKRGNTMAKNHIMRAVTSPSLKVRRSAVKLYYQIEPSRRQAQRELRLLLRPEDRHLLYLY
jgi:hypothetical protein